MLLDIIRSKKSGGRVIVRVKLEAVRNLPIEYILANRLASTGVRPNSLR